MKVLLTALSLLFANLCYCQNFTYPTIHEIGKTLHDFYPPGWILLDSAMGDLNNDRLTDAVLILQYMDSVTLQKDGEMINTQPRIMLILFKGSDGGFTLKERTNSFILSHDHPNMDDPYQDIQIEKGVIKIQFKLFYSAGGWKSTSGLYKFRWNSNDFSLIGAELKTVNRNNLDYTYRSYNFLTRKGVFTSGNEDQGTKKTLVTPLEVTSLQTLKTFQKPFSWELNKAVL
jgi:hypothetical protein